MNRRNLKNVTASIHARLLNEARAAGRPFNELLQYFAMERFLYRLSRSPYSRKFVLKGALMLAAWEVSPTRPTKNIDLLGRMTNDIEHIAGVIRRVCDQEVEPDGLEFEPESVRGDRIAQEAEHEGVRVRFRGALGTAQVSMQIDVGFGDAVVPGPVTTEYPTILDLPAPWVHGYTRESVIAEKLHAMVRRGLLNSRMRDYFDVWVLSRLFDFEGELLAEAIQGVFVGCDLGVDAHPVGLTEQFSSDAAKAAQWRGFLRQSRVDEAPRELVEIVSAIATFLGPVTEALGGGRTFRGRWRAPGPWLRD